MTVADAELDEGMSEVVFEGLGLSRRRPAASRLDRRDATRLSAGVPGTADLGGSRVVVKVQAQAESVELRFAGSRPNFAPYSPRRYEPAAVAASSPWH